MMKSWRRRNEPLIQRWSGVVLMLLVILAFDTAPKASAARILASSRQPQQGDDKSLFSASFASSSSSLRRRAKRETKDISSDPLSSKDPIQRRQGEANDNDELVISLVVEGFDEEDNVFSQEESHPQVQVHSIHANDSVATSITQDEKLHGKASLNLVYHNSPDNVNNDHLYSIQSILDGPMVVSCHGAKQLSFAYKHRIDTDDEELWVNNLVWTVMLFDNVQVNTFNHSTGSNQSTAVLREFEFVGTWTTGRNTDDNGQVWTILAASLQNSTADWKLNGNTVHSSIPLNLMAIKGWKLAFKTRDSPDARGAVWLDQVALDGTATGMLDSIWFTPGGFAQALEQELVEPVYYQSSVSQQNTTQTFFVDNEEMNGHLAVDYTVEQTETWGGNVQYKFHLPGNAYYNLSKVAALSFQYRTERPASPQGRAHLRLILLDKSHSGALQADVGADAQGENYYSFHFVLDNPSGSNKTTNGTWEGWDDISLPLQGDDSSDNPGFWRTGWFGIVGNNELDKEHIKGFNFEVSVDSQGGIGTFVDGAFELSNLKALTTYTPSGIDLSQCVIEPELGFRNAENLQRVEFLNFAECCDSCTTDEECNFAFSDGTHCYKAEFIPAHEVELHVAFRSPVKTFAKQSQDDFCDICDCHQGDGIIDCKGKDLVLVPKAISLGSDPLQWEAQVLDLRNNPRLTVLGQDTLSAVSSTLQELHLPSKMAYVSSKTIQGLPRLTTLTFEDEEEEGKEMETMLDLTKNIILRKDESFSDICCGLGDEVSLPHESLSPTIMTFCYPQPDEPGIDAIYEDFIHYNVDDSKTIATITPSSYFMFEAAESKEKCAEYCSIQPECLFFSFDARSTNSEPTCTLLQSRGNPTRVCCEPDDYEDFEAKTPGWSSGRVARTRHELDNARVLCPHAENGLVLEESKSYTASYDVFLGAMPRRGAVWVTPKVVSVGVEVTISPSKVVLYDNTTMARVIVSANATSYAGRRATIVIEHEVESCDEAFSVDDSNLTVIVEVRKPQPPKKDSSANNTSLFISIGASLFVLVVLSVIFFIYARRKKRQADLVWHVKASELQFSTPPEIVGRGSFGLVLLAEYRGTNVAVKRVLPHHHRTQGRGERSSMFDNELMRPKPHSSQERPLSSSSKSADVEMGLNSTEGFFGSTAKAHQKHFWRKAVQYDKRLDHSKLRADFIDEMRLISKLRHPCIATVMGSVIDNIEEPMLIMEYMDHGSLHDLLQNSTIQLEGEQLLPILQDIAQGVRFLHAAKPGIVHGDLKARNILVDSRLRAKVADFGLCSKKKVGASGTPYWMAPELLRGETTNTTQSDVYAFGIILYEIYSRKSPYEGEDFAEVLEKVSGRWPGAIKRPPIPDSCPFKVVHLMQACWDDIPDRRPSFEELDHKFKSFDLTSVDPQRKSSASIPPPVRRLSTTGISERKLLAQVFPPHVSSALRAGNKVEPEHKEMVTIFFSDIVGFTDISSALSPMQVADMLDRLYTKFDALSEKHEIFKVETIGDSWMGTTNLVQEQPDHVDRLAAFANDAMAAAHETHINPSNPALGMVQIRVGLHSGPVVANVVGSRNPRYCLFGDTVNTAARMESNSLPGRIQCSVESAELLREQNPNVVLQSRGVIFVKGKGQMETFWVGCASTSMSEDDHKNLPEQDNGMPDDESFSKSCNQTFDTLLTDEEAESTESSSTPPPNEPQKQQLADTLQDEPLS